MQRTAELRKLIAYAESLEAILARLNAFGWDSEIPLAIVRPDDLTAVLRRFLLGQLSARQVEEWADALECRDDVGLDEDCEAELRSAIFELANPLLTEQLSQDSAQRILATLTPHCSRRGPAARAAERSR